MRNIMLQKKRRQVTFVPHPLCAQTFLLRQMPSANWRTDSKLQDFKGTTVFPTAIFHFMQNLFSWKAP